MTSPDQDLEYAADHYDAGGEVPDLPRHVDRDMSVNEFAAAWSDRSTQIIAAALAADVRTTRVCVERVRDVARVLDLEGLYEEAVDVLDSIARLEAAL